LDSKIPIIWSPKLQLWAGFQDAHYLESKASALGWIPRCPLFGVQSFSFGLDSKIPIIWSPKLQLWDFYHKFSGILPENFASETTTVNNTL